MPTTPTLSPLLPNVTSNWTEVTVSLPAEAPSWPTYLPLYVTILNVMIFFTGTLGNTLVIVVVVMVREMRTPMNWYLVNLSMADLLVLLVCQPAALLEFYAQDRWFLGAALCEQCTARVSLSAGALTSSRRETPSVQSLCHGSAMVSESEVCVSMTRSVGLIQWDCC